MDQRKADLVIYSKKIYTVAKDDFLDGGIAVTGNSITAVGSREEIEPLVGSGTLVLERGEQMVMPGFIEGHTHVDGSIIKKSRVDLVGVESEGECVRMVKAWDDAHPEEPWVYGFGWHIANWPTNLYPTKKSLDRVLPRKPVTLIDLGCHAIWMNSKALETLGITGEPIDLKAKFGYEGNVIRDDKGEPTGLVNDGPMMMLNAQSTAFMKSEPERYMAEAAADHLEKGITSINEMWLHGDGDMYIDALKSLEDQGKLKFRVFFQYDLVNGDVENAAAAKKRFCSDKLRLVGVKGFADSVWADRSASVVRAYGDDPGNFGHLYIDFDTWAPKVAAANKNSLSVHMHCSGNGAVRRTLDLYQYSWEKNGPGDYRNSVEHCDTVTPEDIPRFGKYKVMANVSPDFMSKTNKWKDSPCHYVYDDETRSWCWPFASMLEAGTVITYGCDCPASDFNPFTQIYRGAARVMDDGEPSGGFLPDEKIPVKTALRFYTYNGAYEARMEDKLGTLEAGKLADIIVLDRNILELPLEEMRKAQVLITIADGKIVYEKDNNK
ncbi:MAG: amidohydrolase family protein [Treponema sp.]|jgi:predicted amidohydrolase YtcJ|nr:amidohydrolase family protein [Treponema sp.]